MDSLIFDMDGTLWDGVECYAQGFNDFFEENNISRNITKEDIYGYMGMEESKFLEVTLPELSVDDRQIAYKTIIEFQNKRIETDGGILYKDVKNGLKELSKKYKLFIVSNCPEFTIDYFMKWAGIENLITDSFAHGKNHKPKHHNIKLIIEKHSLKKPYYIGDTNSDSIQSSLVPLPFVFVDYGFGTTENYDLIFSSFTELKNHFLDKTI